MPKKIPQIPKFFRAFLPDLRGECPDCHAQFAFFDLKEMTCPSCHHELDPNKVRNLWQEDKIKKERKKFQKSRAAGAITLKVSPSKLTLLPGFLFALTFLFMFKDMHLPHNLESWHLSLGVMILVFIVGGRPYILTLSRHEMHSKRIFSPFSSTIKMGANFDLKRIRGNKGSSYWRVIGKTQAEEETVFSTTSKTKALAVLAEIKDFQSSQGL